VRPPRSKVLSSLKVLLAVVAGQQSPSNRRHKHRKRLKARAAERLCSCSVEAQAT